MPAPCNQLEKSFLRLNNAIAHNRSRKWCLSLWSAFIRLRDDNRCVNCGSHRKVSAHHIFRKVVLPEAEFQTGNGATLCKECHRNIHEVFNGRPLQGEPLNARGGDDQDYIASLYHALDRDYRERGIYKEEYYFLSDDVLSIFKRYQGFPDIYLLSGSPVSKAHGTWQMAPTHWYANLAMTLLYNLLQEDVGQ